MKAGLSKITPRSLSDAQVAALAVAAVPTKTFHKKQTAVSINALNTDVTTFTGLPAKYIVRRITVFDASANLGASAAEIAVFTAAAGGGTAVVASAVLTGLTAATKFSDRTIATSADYLTAATLYVRNTVAHGSAATVSIILEYEDLT